MLLMASFKTLLKLKRCFNRNYYFKNTDFKLQSRISISTYYVSY